MMSAGETSDPRRIPVLARLLEVAAYLMAQPLKAISAFTKRLVFPITEAAINETRCVVWAYVS